MTPNLDEETQVKLAIQLSLNDDTSALSSPSSPLVNDNMDATTERSVDTTDTSGGSRSKSGRKWGIFKSKSSKNRSGGSSTPNNNTGGYENNQGEEKKGKIYRARRSLRAKNIQNVPPGGDGDTWIEGFAVSTPEVSEVSSDGIVNITPCVRSYFYSQSTGRRVWDEPPSGASTVRYASQDARALAEAQAEVLANEIMTGTGEQVILPQQQGLPNENQDYEKALKLSADESTKIVPKSKTSDDALERAIALSRLDSQKVSHHAPVSNDDDEALAIAMAMSLSENHSISKGFSDDPKSLLNDEDVTHDDLKQSAYTPQCNLHDDDGRYHPSAPAELMQNERKFSEND